MNTFTQVPPGFRFHPTDEELVDYYLRRKIASRSIDLDVIKDVDLYKIEPWDLQELCRIGAEEQNEWYFFSHKDKKYPTGTRTNRATSAGFWKATGRDKAIYSKKNELVGMRKTLVFYKGRAPNGQKSDWIMHEYRLETDENGAPQEEGWVVCRVFKKKIVATRKLGDYDSPLWYDDQASFIPDMDSSTPHHHHMNRQYQHQYNSCKKEMDHFQYTASNNDHFLQLPLLESPTMIQARTCNPTTPYGSGLEINHGSNLYSLSENMNEPKHDPNLMTDWRVLDQFVASQLSNEEISKANHTSYGPGSVPDIVGNSSLLGGNDCDGQEMGHENASTSSSSCLVDMWKS